MLPRHRVGVCFPAVRRWFLDNFSYITGMIAAFPGWHFGISDIDVDVDNEIAAVSSARVQRGSLVDIRWFWVVLLNPEHLHVHVLEHTFLP